MEYLVRLAHSHTTFRVPELEALSEVLGLKLEILEYSNETPYCVVRVDDADCARRLVQRAMSVISVHELWGVGTSYEELHQNIKHESSHLWSRYKTDISFRFAVHGFQGKRSMKKQRQIIETFKYLAFEGPIRMIAPDEEFGVFEEYLPKAEEPHKLYFGRFLGHGGRNDILTFDLKRRAYISTTSMDAELAFITANMALASPGKLFYDPFMGTGGFPVACAHFGAMTFGGDIDGRSVRGHLGPTPMSNFVQYKLTSLWLDGLIADLVNTPLRTARWLDGIVCDPPYGVREGLKVLGSKYDIQPKLDADGVYTYLKPEYIASKKPYSFERMLDDILQFAAEMLVDGGRLCMWMPHANDEDVALAIPQNDDLELCYSSVQHFNKWSRRLLTYKRVPKSQIGSRRQKVWTEVPTATASDLNNFRKRYFDGFKSPKPYKANS